MDKEERRFRRKGRGCYWSALFAFTGFLFYFAPILSYEESDGVVPLSQNLVIFGGEVDGVVLKDNLFAMLIFPLMTTAIFCSLLGKNVPSTLLSASGLDLLDFVLMLFYKSVFVLSAQDLEESRLSVNWQYWALLGFLFAAFAASFVSFAKARRYRAGIYEKLK